MQRKICWFNNPTVRQLEDCVTLLCHWLLSRRRLQCRIVINFDKNRLWFLIHYKLKLRSLFHLVRMLSSFSEDGLGVVVTRWFCLELALGSLTWLKASVSAEKAATYKQIHNGKEGEFEKAITNLTAIVRRKRDKQLGCTLGERTLLLEENDDEIETLAKICRDDIGLDYLVVKPYSRIYSAKHSATGSSATKIHRLWPIVKPPVNGILLPGLPGPSHAEIGRNTAVQ